MLEKRLQKVIHEFGSKSLPVREWPWMDMPFSKHTEYIDTREDKVFFEEIDYLIDQAPVTEALTSPAKYVRECKRWYLDAKKS